ncbi:MAG: hypothetical protein MHM6MM_003399 [Cercozoa sp. M6MM]
MSLLEERNRAILSFLREFAPDLSSERLKKCANSLKTAPEGRQAAQQTFRTLLRVAEAMEVRQMPRRATVVRNVVEKARALVRTKKIARTEIDHFSAPFAVLLRLQKPHEVDLESDFGTADDVSGAFDRVLSDAARILEPPDSDYLQWEQEYRRSLVDDSDDSEVEDISDNESSERKQTTNGVGDHNIENSNATINTNSKSSESELDMISFESTRKPPIVAAPCAIREMCDVLISLCDETPQSQEPMSANLYYCEQRQRYTYQGHSSDHSDYQLNAMQIILHVATLLREARQTLMDTWLQPSLSVLLRVTRAILCTTTDRCLEDSRQSNRHSITLLANQLVPTHVALTALVPELTTLLHNDSGNITKARETLIALICYIRRAAIRLPPSNIVNAILKGDATSVSDLRYLRSSGHILAQCIRADAFLRISALVDRVTLHAFSPRLCTKHNAHAMRLVFGDDESDESDEGSYLPSSSELFASSMELSEISPNLEIDESRNLAIYESQQQLRRCIDTVFHVLCGTIGDVDCAIDITDNEHEQLTESVDRCIREVGRTVRHRLDTAKWHVFHSERQTVARAQLIRLLLSLLSARDDTLLRISQVTPVAGEAASLTDGELARAALSDDLNVRGARLVIHSDESMSGDGDFKHATMRVQVSHLPEQLQKRLSSIIDALARLLHARDALNRLRFARAHTHGCCFTTDNDIALCVARLLTVQHLLMSHAMWSLTVVSDSLALAQTATTQKDFDSHIKRCVLTVYERLFGKHEESSESEFMRRLQRFSQAAQSVAALRKAITSKNGDIERQQFLLERQWRRVKRQIELVLAVLCPRAHDMSTG